MKTIKIDYTNYHGDRRIREIEPITIWHGSTEWHSGEQWFLRAIDAERAQLRDFALKDIHGFIDEA